MNTHLCISNDSLLFKRASTRALLGILPFATLELHAEPHATEDELLDMKYMSEDFVPGQVIVNASKQEVVLGPPRDFRFEVVLHGVGNPDHQQYGDVADKTVVRLVDVTEAAAVVREYQRRNDMGGGNCSPEHGCVWTVKTNANPKRKKLGRVCYGGRYDTVAEIKASEAETKAKYPATK